MSPQIAQGEGQASNQTPALQELLARPENQFSISVEEASLIEDAIDRGMTDQEAIRIGEGFRNSEAVVRPPSEDLPRGRPLNEDPSSQVYSSEEEGDEDASVTHDGRDEFVTTNSADNLNGKSVTDERSDSDSSIDTPGKATLPSLQGRKRSMDGETDRPMKRARFASAESSPKDAVHADTGDEFSDDNDDEGKTA
ncbi:hypothetical protein DL768_003845 [Monosporascus sp. mg162]|nr:hypothetical protein DL768_003845 [Monosporascus sp. mg162]